jgi:pimeloyl-ACP methyl ester carboxylesterase
MTKTTPVFIHGLEGSSRGRKALFFKERYPHMLIEDFTGTFGERMEKLNGLLGEEEALVLVGSSYGGLMAAVYAFDHPDRVKKLVLLAPALAFEQFDIDIRGQVDLPVVIYHGSNDQVLPLSLVRENADRVFENLVFNVVDDDHVLSRTFEFLDWDNLLKN